MSTDQDWVGLDQDWSQFRPDQDWIGLEFFFTDVLNGSVYLAIKGKNFGETIFQFYFELSTFVRT